MTRSMESYGALHRFVLHLPVVTTVVAAVFAWQLFSRYRVKGGGLHLVWWGHRHGYLPWRCG